MHTNVMYAHVPLLLFLLMCTVSPTAAAVVSIPPTSPAATSRAIKLPQELASSCISSGGSPEDSVWKACRLTELLTVARELATLVAVMLDRVCDTVILSNAEVTNKDCAVVFRSGWVVSNDGSEIIMVAVDKERMVT